MRNTAFVLGIIAAFLLLVGGCAGYVTGSVFEVVEDVTGEEFDDDGEGSTTEEVEGAGGAAMAVAVYLFVASGLTRVLLRTSTVMLALSLPMLLGIVITDTTSIFAVTYYLALLLNGICTFLMIQVWRAGRTRPRTEGVEKGNV